MGYAWSYSSHSEDSNDSDTEVFDPPSTNTKYNGTSVEDLVEDGERSRLETGICGLTISVKGSEEITFCTGGWVPDGDEHHQHP